MTTLDQLKKLGRHLAGRFSLCGENEVAIEHSLIHCLKGNRFVVFSFCFLQHRLVLS